MQSCLAPPRAVAVTRRTRTQYSSRLERADQEEGAPFENFWGAGA